MAGQRAIRLAELAAEACSAETRGETWAVGEAWRRYELVLDGGRDPDDLLAEGIGLSSIALDLLAQAEHREA